MVIRQAMLFSLETLALIRRGGELGVMMMQRFFFMAETRIRNEYIRTFQIRWLGCKVILRSAG